MEAPITLVRLLISHVEYHAHIYLALYKGDTDVGLYDVDMNPVGSCSRPAEPQLAECSGGISFTTLVNLYDCEFSPPIHDDGNHI